MGISTIGRFADLKGQVFNVKAYGAMGDGLNDDYPAITRALSAASGGMAGFPQGTYKCSQSLSIPPNVSLKGFGPARISFSSPTDGLVFSNNSRNISVENLSISASNSGCLKALRLTNMSSCRFSGVSVDYSGSGRWAYGLWASNSQNNEFHSLKMVSATTVGAHLEFHSNANTFTGLQINGASTASRGIESDTSANFYQGCTIQGYFLNSLLRSTNINPGWFDGMWFEPTNASPADGADVVLLGTCYNASFSHIHGGSFKVGDGMGLLQHFHISDSESDVTLNSDTFESLLSGVRGTVTDGGTNTTIIGCSNAAKTQSVNKIARGVRMIPETFSALPAAATAIAGMERVISDSSVTTLGLPALGGGSATVKVFCNGNAWTVSAV